MKYALLSVIALGAAAVAAVPPARGQQTAAPAVLAELFTSQSCSPCPPAQEFFAELAEEPGVVTLEWHVDYWDDLVYGRYGQWKDPYSDPAFTARQRQYNQVLRGTRSVYTPQAIVGGVTETTGSRRQTIRQLIEDAGSPQASLTFGTRDGIATLTVATEEAAEIWLAFFEPEAETHVQRGENHGRALKSRNIVRQQRSLGRLSTGTATYGLPEGQEGWSCAVIVQAPGSGRVLAAADCPAV